MVAIFDISIIVVACLAMTSLVTMVVCFVIVGCKASKLPLKVIDILDGIGLWFMVISIILCGVLAALNIGREIFT